MQPPIAATLSPSRFRSVDILRGLIMIVMALDHVRDYFHFSAGLQNPVDVTTTYPALFFTRWITHFCAPGFLFLSGISASFAAQKRMPAAMSAFLIKRGLWLILVEMLVITLAITFDPFYHTIAWQVIWAIGWSMIVLALLRLISVKAVIIVGFILLLGHDVFDFLQIPKTGVGGTLLQIWFTSPATMLPAGRFMIFDMYAILPWTALMLLGYGLGTYAWATGVSPRQRQHRLFVLGIWVIVFFLVLRGINIYGDPSRWSVQASAWRTVLSFLNVSKYPPSLLYSCMTVGPLLILLSLAEHAQSGFARFLEVYGKVPFFYYVLHFFLVHALCTAAFFATGGTLAQGTSGELMFAFRPVHFGFSLWVVYAVWISVVAILYFPSRWFGRYKATHRQWWLSYL